MFRVLDTGKEAKIPKSKHSGWHNNTFSTLYEARYYADTWLGPGYEGLIPNSWQIELNKKYMYSAKNYIQIVQCDC